MKKFAIWGMGLLGTSLALDLKKRGEEIIAIEKSAENIEALNSFGFKKNFQSDDYSFIPELKSCDGIIIGTPIDQVFPILEKISSYDLPESVWITDMASTKGELMRKVNNCHSKLNGNLNFIGSHPMAGSDQSGPNHAKSDMFVNATIYVTPVNQPLKPGITDEVSDFWKGVGARPFIIDSEIHDKWAAYLSHGLHLVSCMVSHLLEDIPEVYKLESPPAGGSFKDITRVAGSNPKLWDGIINSNANEVTSYLESMEKLIGEWKTLLAEKKLPVEDIFKKAAKIRNTIIKNNTGVV